jgi:hypothetical protein
LHKKARKIPSPGMNRNVDNSFTECYRTDLERIDESEYGKIACQIKSALRKNNKRSLVEPFQYLKNPEDDSGSE